MSKITDNATSAPPLALPVRAETRPQKNAPAPAVSKTTSLDAVARRHGIGTALVAAGHGTASLRTEYISRVQRTHGNRAVGKLIEAHQRSAQPGKIPLRSKASHEGPSQERHPHPSARLNLGAKAEHRGKPPRTSAATAAPVKFPEPKSAGSKILLEALQGAVQHGRESVANATDAAERSVTEAGDREAQSVQAAETQHVGSVREHFDSSKRQASQSATQQTAAIHQAKTSHQGALGAWHQQASARGQKEVAERQQDVLTAGNEQVTSVQQSGEDSAKAADSNLTTASAQARSGGGGGGDERSEGHAEVKNRLGGDAAAQFEAAAGDTGTKLRNHASEAATELQSHAQAAGAAVGGHAAVLDAQVAETAALAHSGLDETAGHGTSQLHAGLSHVHAELDASEGSAVETLQTHGAEHREHIHSAAAAATDALHGQANAAIQAGEQQLTREAARIASSHVDPKAAGMLAPVLRSQVTGAFGTAAQQAPIAASQINGHLTSAASTSKSAIAGTSSSVANKLGSANQTVATKMTSVAGHASASLAKATKATTAGGEQAITQTGTHLAETVSQARTGFAAASGAATKSLNEHVAEGSRLTSDAMSGLQTRISDGNARVDGFVSGKDSQKAAAPVQRSVLGSIGHWFAEQFSDLWDMLKSPSFWVGLIVTVVLLPVMGPGALVIGGLAAGATSGIEQNLAQGKHWYDPHNIIRGAFIGALAGAAMAFGVGLIMGLGLEGAALVGATMALSAVIGIVTNLATGQRWDKNLLANLFLAWLFQKVGGGKPEAETPGAKPPETPGRTTERVPGLEEGLDPAVAPQGWTFNDTFTTSGPEVIVRTEVRAADGSSGHVTRGYNSQTGEFILHEAFLDGIPNRWVATDPPMVQGRGTPLETYLTMRQMKLLTARGAAPARPFSAPRVVRMSTVINVETVLQLAKAAKAGVPRDQAVLNSHSVNYARNSIVQSGGRIASAHVDGGFDYPASSIAATPEQLAKYGIAPSEQVLYGFDIEINVVSADAPAPANAPKTPVVPVPVPVPDDDRGSRAGH